MNKHNLQYNMHSRESGLTKEKKTKKTKHKHANKITEQKNIF